MSYDPGYNSGKHHAPVESAATARRRDLRTYVTAWITHGETPDPRVLAGLVNDAPAKQTLTDDEWWNVALLLAQEMTYRAFREGQ